MDGKAPPPPPKQKRDARQRFLGQQIFPVCVNMLANLKSLDLTNLRSRSPAGAFPWGSCAPTSAGWARRLAFMTPVLEDLMIDVTIPASHPLDEGELDRCLEHRHTSIYRRWGPSRPNAMPHVGVCRAGFVLAEAEDARVEERPSTRPKTSAG